MTLLMFIHVYIVDYIIIYIIKLLVITKRHGSNVELSKIKQIVIFFRKNFENGLNLMSGKNLFCV